MSPRAIFLLALLCSGTLSLAAQTFTVSTSGNDIIASVGAGLQGSFCCRGTTLDSPTVAAICSQSCPANPVITDVYQCNWVGTHTVYASWSDPSTNGYVNASQTVTVTTPPPITCTIPNKIEFDITNAGPTNDKRILLSNLHTNAAGTPVYPYPRFQGFLSRDGAILVGFRVIDEGEAKPGITVTLRVSDPADPSPYMAGGASIVQPVPGSQAGDNFGTVLPKLKGPGVTDNGNGTYTIVSGSNGYAEVDMELDASARAGDNYQVVATATFTDGVTRTFSSGVITAWKRMFVEKRQMFRRGAFLATDAPAGTDSIVIPAGPIASAGTQAFRKDDYVLLMHAPSWGQPKTPANYHSGVYRISARPSAFRAGEPAAGRGTLTTNGTTAIVGTGTRFTRMRIGDVINVPTSVPEVMDPRVVIAIADDTHLTVHKPPTLAAPNLSYTVGDSNLIPGQSYVRLRLNRPLTETYSREPLVPADQRIVMLNDAVARLTAATVAAADYFDGDHSLLDGIAGTKTFPAAQTEYVVLSPSLINGGLPVPRANLPTGKDIADQITQQFIDKWFALPQPSPLPSTDPNPLTWYRYEVAPNHQLLLVGDSEASDVTQSGSNGFLSRSIAGERASVLHRATVEYNVTNSQRPPYGADVDTLLSRTLVHEIMHQWWVNDGVFGGFDHCFKQVAYDSGSPYPTSSGTPPPGLTFCLMTDPDPTLVMPAPWDSRLMIGMVEYHYRSAKTSCHVTRASGWHSEYLSVRRAPDPWTP